MLPASTPNQDAENAGTSLIPTESTGKSAPSKPKYQRIGVEARMRVLELSADNVKNSEISRITGISTQRVSEILNLHGDLKGRVRQVLDAQRVKAAEAWGRAIPKAAKKGDHRPARELLIATGDVSPLDSAGSGVTVVVNMPSSQPEMGAKVVGSASTLDNAFVMPSPQVIEP
jgi:hypothetical protein